MGLISDTTAFGLFAMAFLVPLAAGSLWYLARERARGQVVRFMRLVLWLSVTFLVGSGLVLAGWLWPDEYDRLTAEERRAIGPALRSSWECGTVPFARVVDVSINRTPGRQVVLKYTCGVTPFGLPRFHNEATCGSAGLWHVPGVLDVQYVGDCSLVEGD
jgi:hypothetical protein